MDAKLIAIDIGNTNTDLGLIDIQALTSINRYSLQSSINTESIIACIERIKTENRITGPLTIKLCSVEKSTRKNVVTAISSMSDNISISCVRYHKNLPLQINYKSPESLGADRIANSLYGLKKFPGENLIIIDTGTAVTIDLLFANGEFAGGFILPGTTAQLSSLHNNTSGLPYIECATSIGHFLPNSTQSGMISGVCYGVAGGISFIVKKLLKEFPDSSRILSCGGAWKTIENFIDFEYNFIPDLTLVGVGLFEE